ncbi:MAG: M20 family metallopeptidase [Salibacteraceae bacterium]
MTDLSARVKALAEAYVADTIKVRRHLHQHPELSFEEVETSQYVAAYLDQLCIPYESGLVKTGLRATISGKNPSAKVIALRADLDALPIAETNEVPYRSTNEGVMHACGHDVHTASLLGSMRILNDLRTEFEGSISCVFQPGEELLPGGAKLMIEEGVLQNPKPQRMFGQHVYPDMEAGKVGFRSGMYMASSDEIRIKVIGKGGHAALPHLVVDPILIASHLVVALQQLVSRNSQPDLPTVLSVGWIEVKGATNIIPNEVMLMGTFRTFDEVWRQDALQKLSQLAIGLVESMGGKCELDIRKGYPFLVNDEATTQLAKSRAIHYLGAENVIDLDLRMTAEDFAYYSQVVPSCFYRLGVRNEAKGITSGLHTPTFDIDEKALETSIGLMAWLALEELRN